MNDTIVYFIVVCISTFGGFVAGCLYRIYCEEGEKNENKK